VEFEYDAEAASRRDDLREAINYDRVVSMVTEHITWQKYQLMEAACGGILSMLRDAYPELLTITIEVAKREAVPAAKESYCRMVWSVPGGGQV
jgi:dihydroneopterin aldolase